MDAPRVFVTAPVAVRTLEETVLSPGVRGVTKTLTAAELVAALSRTVRMALATDSRRVFPTNEATRTRASNQPHVKKFSGGMNWISAA